LLGQAFKTSSKEPNTKLKPSYKVKFSKILHESWKSLENQIKTLGIRKGYKCKSSKQRIKRIGTMKEEIGIASLVQMLFEGIKVYQIIDLFI